MSRPEPAGAQARGTRPAGSMAARGQSGRPADGPCPSSRDRNARAPADLGGRSARSVKPKASRSSPSVKRRARASGSDFGLEPGGEVRPVGLGNTPVAADLVAQLQTLGGPVVARVLVGGGELGDPGKPVGGQESAFDREGVKGELGAAEARWVPGRSP